MRRTQLPQRYAALTIGLPIGFLVVVVIDLGNIKYSLLHFFRQIITSEAFEAVDWPADLHQLTWP